MGIVLNLFIEAIPFIHENALINNDYFAISVIKLQQSISHIQLNKFYFLPF